MFLGYIVEEKLDQESSLIGKLLKLPRSIVGFSQLSEKTRHSKSSNLSYVARSTSTANAGIFGPAFARAACAAAHRGVSVP